MLVDQDERTVHFHVFMDENKWNGWHRRTFSLSSSTLLLSRITSWNGPSFIVAGLHLRVRTASCDMDFIFSGSEKRIINRQQTIDQVAIWLYFISSETSPGKTRFPALWYEFYQLALVTFVSWVWKWYFLESLEATDNFTAKKITFKNLCFKQYFLYKTVNSLCNDHCNLFERNSRRELPLRTSRKTSQLEEMLMSSS